jgi:hypothetical protein
MSGSESSAPADLRRAAPEALGLTVHALPAPVIDERRRRVLGGRLRMLTILLACAAPVIASYLTYYVVRPQGRTNYSTLVSPSRSLPDDLGLRTLDGAAVASASLRGQWLMVLVGPAACDAACERRIYLQRQLREMLGREARPSPALLQAAQATGPLTVLHADPAALARWLAPEAGHTLAEHLYVVDPMGEWMMRSPADPEPKRLKSDLDRLLRASSSWDRAGR